MSSLLFKFKKKSGRTCLKLSKEHLLRPLVKAELRSGLGLEWGRMTLLKFRKKSTPKTYRLMSKNKLKNNSNEWAAKHNQQSPSSTLKHFLRFHGFSQHNRSKTSALLKKSSTRIILDWKKSNKEFLSFWQWNSKKVTLKEISSVFMALLELVRHPLLNPLQNLLEGSSQEFLWEVCMMRLN